MMGLAWSEDPESYGSSSVATGRVYHARQVKADDPDEKGYPVLPGWELGVGLTISPHKKVLYQDHHKDISEGTREERRCFLRGRPWPRRGCSTIHRWIDGIIFYFKIVRGVWQKHTKL